MILNWNKNKSVRQFEQPLKTIKFFMTLIILGQIPIWTMHTP